MACAAGEAAGAPSAACRERGRVTGWCRPTRRHAAQRHATRRRLARRHRNPMGRPACEACERAVPEAGRGGCPRCCCVLCAARAAADSCPPQLSRIAHATAPPALPSSSSGGWFPATRIGASVVDLGVLEAEGLLDTPAARAGCGAAFQVRGRAGGRAGEGAGAAGHARRAADWGLTALGRVASLGAVRGSMPLVRGAALTTSRPPRTPAPPRRARCAPSWRSGGLRGARFAPRCR